MAQRLVVHHDEHGHPVKAEILPPDWLRPLLQGEGDFGAELSLPDMAEVNRRLSLHASEHDSSDVVLL